MMDYKKLQEKEVKRKKDNEVEKALLDLTISLMSEEERKYFDKVVEKLRSIFKDKPDNEDKMTSPGFAFLVALAKIKNEVENEVMGDMSDALEKLYAHQQTKTMNEKDFN